MAVVESVVEILLQKLADPLVEEAFFLHGVHNQVEWLEEEFKQMQCFLKDADAKQERDGRVKNWMRNVRDAAYDAEDVIDTLVSKTELLRQRGFELLRQRGFVGRIRRCAFIFNKLIARHKVSSEIEWIKIKIQMISESRLAYGIENMGQGAGTSSTGLRHQDWRLTSLGQEPDFVGFEKDFEILVSRLTEGGFRGCVVSVVGMGGLGKTTLTKKVYNDTRVKTQFHSCAWISISQEYDVKDLLQNIINCYMVLSKEELKKVQKMNVFQLRDKIFEFLQEKRYLMVLDDIWTIETFDALKDAFPDMNNGSRIMLTTRNKDIALHADAQSTPYELRFLETDESWELFHRKVFAGQDTGCPQDLEKLGKEIVEKCHGLPLAILLIGGLLSMKEPREWENVRETISWQFVKGQPEISRILSLSYRDLPYHLKPCFLYLGIFPKDYEFLAKKLIRLWAAEGLLQQRGDETLEEMGEDYLNELIQRSMIQVDNRSSSRGIKSCRIHDLLQDLSISEAKEDKFLQVHENMNSPFTSAARRLAIYRNDSSKCTFLKSSTPRLRSVLIHTTTEYGSLRRKEEKFLYRGFKLLRVLDLQNVAIKNLPSEIGALIHLRYLGLTKTWLKRLPSSIGNLRNLQTLIVTTHNDVLNIPRAIEKMQQLRHVQVYNAYETYYECCGVIEGHPRLNEISNLQTLSYVRTGEWMCGCLGKLVNLRKLGICLDLEEAYAEVLFESIVKLDCLQSLTVTAHQLASNFPFPHLLKLSKLRLVGELEKLPESAEFPTNLTNLTLLLSHLKQDPLATLEKLKNLHILRLLWSSYQGKDMACAAQGFPRLESLHLQGLHQLEEWRVEKGAMPTLLHLQINECSNLKILPEGLKHMSTLKKLELLYMPNKFKERLREDNREDWHKIHHIPYIDIQ